MPFTSVPRRRVVVLSATSNIGLATVRGLRRPGHQVVGVAPRRPDPGTALGVEWVACDLTRDDLTPIMRGADVVVHFTRLAQTSHDLAAQRTANVGVLDRILTTCRAVGLPKLVIVSSVGTYSARRDTWPVSEEWPSHGLATSARSRLDAYVDRMLDAHESVSSTRVVRLRPCLVIPGSAAPLRRHLLAGALLDGLVHWGRLPVVPDLRQVAFQAIHADDVVGAIRAAADRDDAGGAYNIATPEILSTADVAHLLGARTVPVPFGVARAAVRLSWRLRLHPLEPDWLDVARWSPLLDSTRARDQLGWRPSLSGHEALQALLTAEPDADSSAPLALSPDRDVHDPIRELLTGTGPSTKERHQ